MGCFDFFDFKNDYQFQNHKGDIVIIPKDEYQTKDLKSLLNCLKINKEHEIECMLIWYRCIFLELFVLQSHYQS